MSFQKNSISVIEHESLGPARGTLLFIHGRFSGSEIWSPLVRPFLKEFNCLFIELPGFGSSFTLADTFPSLLENSKFVADLMESPQFRAKGPFVLVGHDAGAAIGQLLAVQGGQKQSDSMKGMIFLNPLNLGEDIAGRSWRQSCFYMNYVLRFQVLKSVDRAVTISREDKMRILEVWNSRSSRKSLIGALQGLNSCWPGFYERLYWRKAMNSIRVPVLLLAGMRDLLSPPEHLFGLVRGIPETYFFISEECGHWPSVENPSWVTSKMREFVARVVPQVIKKRA